MTGAQWGGPHGAQWGGEHGATWGSRSAVVERDISWVVGPVRASYLAEERPTITIGQTSDFLFNLGTVAQYNTLRDRIEFASGDHVVTGIYEDGTPYYKERHDQDFSLVMKIRPSADTEKERGIWGVLVDAEDETNPPLTKYHVSLTMFVLARDTAYNSRQQVATVHEADDIIEEVSEDVT